MLRDPAILILDEATSAVDIQDEALIRKAIEEFAEDRTTFLITHSLGSIQFADRIVLMNDGRIEAVGTDQRAEPHLAALPPAPRDPLPPRKLRELIDWGQFQHFPGGNHGPPSHRR